MAFEGLDGSGKTTLIHKLSEVLKKRGLNPVLTREPGGTEVGQRIRDILLKKEKFPPPLPSVETLLYYGDRQQNMEQVIRPALKKGYWVLSDRYWASTSAFQCGGRGEDEGFVNFLRDRICGDCQPDLWVLPDLPVEEALRRLHRPGRGRDRFELESGDFHQRVREYYLNLAEKNPEKWLILNGQESPDQLIRQLLTHLEEKKFSFQPPKSD